MTDAIDLSSAEIVRGPKDVASWTPTVDITKLTMKPGDDKGQSFEAAVPLTWDFHVPGWGDPAAGDDGNVLYTVWAVINVNGRLYASGFIQMWKGRQWTGAPILTSYENWWGDARGLWGPMKDYVPSVGSTVGFFLTAGNGRLVDGVTSVKERTNVVAVQIPTGNSGEWNFKTVASATPQAPPAQPPAQATTPAGPAAQSPAPSDDRVNALLKTVSDLQKRIDQLEAAALKAGDRVALRTDNGHVVCAEGGGGGAVHSDRENVGTWETFKLEKQ